MNIIIVAEAGYLEYSKALIDSSKHNCVVSYEYCYLSRSEFCKTLSNLESDRYDALCLAISMNRDLERILLDISQLGIKKLIYMIRLYALHYRKNFLDNSGDFNLEDVDLIKGTEPYLVHIETHVNDYCNLNCKACNNYAPFCNETRSNTIAAFEYSLRTITQYCRVGRFFILGGEPLLEKEAAIEYMTISRGLMPGTEIRLLTNGLYLTQMDHAFWDCVRDNHIIIHITQYPPFLRIKESVKACLIQNKVLYYFGAIVNLFEKRLTLSKDGFPELNNMICDSSGCHSIYNGHITKCPDEEYVKYLDRACGTELYSGAGIDISEMNEDRTWITCLTQPTSLCSFCRIDRRNWIPWDRISGTARLDDWIISDEPESIKNNYNIVGFGAGNNLRRNYDLLVKGFGMKLVADNKNKKWGKEFLPGVTCISPDELVDISDLFVIILLEDYISVSHVIQQLKVLGINKYIHLRNLVPAYIR